VVELAIGVAAFLFLCWVAIQGFALMWAIFESITESKEGRYTLIALLPFLLLWLVAWYYTR
jgi:hypothetical protein